ncbi:Acyl hydrolase, partial [Trema orientale]
MTKLFSSGSELANVVVGSDLLQQSWKAILELANGNPDPGLRFGISQEGKNPTIITFFTSHDFAIDQLKQGPDLVSSSSSVAKDSFGLFVSLSGKTQFAINRAAISLFDQHRDKLRSELKDKINDSNRLIITGYSLGGSVALLFTLWLLESVTSQKPKPLCITFGSPLIGDTGLQKALVQYSWNSYFLNVVSDQDPVPKLFINPDLSTETAHLENGHKPFGTFLLCSGSGCSCFEDPETVLQLLVKTAASANQDLNQRNGLYPYGNIVEYVKRKALCRDNSNAEWAPSPFAAGIITQLSAVGITSPQDQNEEIDGLVERMEKQEKKFLMAKNKSLISFKKLTDTKIFMTYLEWYKKASEDKNIGYYDCFKKKLSKTDMDVDEFCRRLTNYWIDMVEAAEKKPQKEGASFRMRCLFGGTNYRRMVEPLHIAKYYNRKGGKQARDYRNQGRHRHFGILEEWLEQWQKEQKNEVGSTTPNDRKRKMVAASLT